MSRLLSLPIKIISLLREKGPFYSLCFIVSYLCLTLRQIIRKKRFDLYDLHATRNPKKNGFFVPDEEWELDPPRKSSVLKNHLEDIFIFGTNTKLEYLTLHVLRIPDNNVKCFLLLRLSDGKIYTLPKEHSIQKATDDDLTFGSSRLKLQCLIPLRKWRIFFNGILEEHSEDSTTKLYKHVKFTLLWAPSSDVFDFSTDMSKTLISHSAAASTSWTSLPIFYLQKLNSMFDRYEQAGMFLGTFQIEKEPEKELYLWGARARSVGKIADLQNSNFLDIYGNFKNGSMIHLGLLNTPALIQQFVFGYIMCCDGHLYPVEEMDYNTYNSSEETMHIKYYAGGQFYDIIIDGIKKKNNKFQNDFNSLYSVEMIKLTMNKKEGTGFIFKGIIEESNHLCAKPSSKEIDYSRYKDLPSYTSLVVTFENERCKLKELCGGKGSSLGKLFALANQTTSNEIKFTVPNGVVVTTRSYEEFMKQNLESVLRKFEEDVWSQRQDDVSLLCQKTVETVNGTKLPEHVKKAIATELKLVFGESFVDRKFAVRSSATGEDTEQMSAAGQMETFLGVKGSDEIFAAVSKCWASQFTFQAVEYKRRYGQRLNTPMAVVIQEMVPCDVAGVIFTCDPVTGNPSYITLTANWGLGESVVSASAEPDTIILERSVENELRCHSKTLGKKKTKIVMSGPEGTKEEELSGDLSSAYCISEIKALQIGKIALAIEDEYGSARDIEWGIAKEKIFLFQSRPVTSLDVETDFENMHFCDSAMRCEMEILTRAHVGEASPGALSVLGRDIMMKLNEIANTLTISRFDGESSTEKPYSQMGVLTAFHQVFFNLISGPFKFNSDAGDATKAILVSFFGRLIDDKEIRPLAEERHPPKKKKISMKDFFRPFYFFFSCYFSGAVTRRAVQRLRNYRIPYKDKSSPHEILQIIGTNLDTVTKAMAVHIDTSMSSSFWNSLILTLLAKAEGDWNNVVYSDFAYLLSTCTEVESANVPAAIQDLAFSISRNIEPAVFKTMDVEDAIKWLRNTSSEVGQKYKQFLERHGHRCIKEFDVFSEVWETNPKTLVKSLQAVVNENSRRPTEKEIDSFRVVLSKLKVKLNFLERLKLFWYLPNTRRAVREREFSKGFLIKLINCIREAFNNLAERMVLEGRLQNKEHLFFLHVEEIKQLCNSRSPRLVATAARRRKCFEIVDKMMFSEIFSGIPKPINDTPIVTGKGFVMTGVPVSQGVVTGIARVVENIGEASNIQPDDILITYCTDTAWSPYFPLLKGVVTELGGLISHGAVVAREYGLPCVVALHGATRVFKSGEIVLLDGNNGILQKVYDD